MSSKTFTGLITKAQDEILCFEIEQTNTIFYFGLWMVSHQNVFPKVGDTIAINLCDDTVGANGEYNIVVLCGRCEVELPHKNELNDDHTLLNLISRHNLDENCSLKIHDLNINLRRYIENNEPEVGVERIIVAIIAEILKDPEEEVLTENLLQFDIKPISMFKIVDDNNKNYKKFPFWIYGMKLNHVNREYMFGYFRINCYGLPVLCDAVLSMPVIIIDNKNIRQLVNRFVMIKKSIVTMEIFNTNNVHPVSCLILDVSDVIVLELIPTLHEDSINVIEMAVTREFTLNFDLLHIGPVCMGPNSAVQCWLKASNDTLGKFYIVLDSTLIKIRPLLKVNETYTILHDEPLKNISWNEIQRLDQKPAYVFSDPNTKFVINEQPNSSNQPKSELEGVIQAATYLEHPGKMINITGFIAAKTFFEGLESYHGGKKHSQPFGTASERIHIIHLLKDNNDLMGDNECEDEDDCLRLFLNDFNRYVLPFCLLPGMTVNIYNVISQSKEYYKCSPFTVFELVEYNVKGGSSANLSSLHKGFQSGEEKTFLSLENMILYDVIYLSHLKIFCIENGVITFTAPDRNLRIELNLQCQDEFGMFYLTVTSSEVFKKMLGFSKTAYSSFVKAFEEIQEFRYTCTLEFEESDDAAQKLKYALYQLLTNCNNLLGIDILIYVCRVEATSEIPHYITMDF